MTKIIVVGTSHISPEAMEKVRKVIQKEKPDAVALELCANRLMAMQMNIRKPTLRFGITGFFLSWLQNELSKLTGIVPGTEMIIAIQEAKKINSKIFLVDIPIEITMRKIKKIPKREKIKLFYKMLTGLLGKGTKMDLNKMPSEKLVRQAISFLKDEFPGFYKILITDRNRHMTLAVKGLSTKFKKIVLVVGAGHEKEIKRMLK